MSDGMQEVGRQGGVCRGVAGDGDQGEPDARALSREELLAYLRSRSTVSVPFAGASCGISRAASYAAAREGSLKTLKLGHRLLVPTMWLERELGLQTEGQGDER